MSALTIDVDHFRARVLQDALTSATSAYWLRRAATFASVGNDACDEIAEACRNHAALLSNLAPEPISEEILAVLYEVAA